MNIPLLLSKLRNWWRLLGRLRHQRNIRTARRVLARLARLDSEAAVLAYLRKIDPLVFEELTLTLFENDGCVVRRNTRYSGDGGQDGQVRLPQGLFAIQCKRYRAHIDPAHVEDFARLVEREKFAGGIFAHTGRTGGESYRRMGGRRIVLLSGADLARAAGGRGSAVAAVTRKWERVATAAIPAAATECPTGPARPGRRRARG